MNNIYNKTRRKWMEINKYFFILYLIPKTGLNSKTVTNEN